MSDPDWIESTRQSYDTVADNYADFTRAAMGRAPVANSFLDLFSSLVDREGRVLDAGCGPGWVTAYLRDRGLNISGIDLSPRLIEIARTNYPEIGFEVGSITELPSPNRSLAGITCWWVLHHVPDSSLSTVLAQFFEKLKPGGYLLVGGHLGASTHTKTEGYGGLPMNVNMVKRSLDTFAELLEARGFVIDLQATLDPASTAPGLILLAHKTV
ncbi:class I SAM-dependent methyltransferase [Leifsonia poae]|uniref:Methyltransferase n=1 Tax=Leifsonia poae TaxID=110933 RepID=A0A9W6H9T7_9MICO|nr:class I SAM-dependent methyltransferase [Leifsonia poae]GLJ76549.1 methyltransferase [Leifsonia poae]